MKSFVASSLRRFVVVCLVSSTATSSMRAAEEPKPTSDPFVDSFLTMSLAYLNQTFLSIGILGDALSTDLYEEEQVSELLSAHLTLATNVETRLTALKKSPDLDADDQAVVERMLRIAGLLKSQVKALEAVYNGDESQVQKWEELRETTATELATFDAEEQTAETPAETKKS